MAGTAPNTRNWKAIEMPDFVGRIYRLTVTGEVEVSASNLTPVLTVHNPQGFNPRILLLDLAIVSGGGFGGQIMMWKPAQYARTTSGNQYDEVDILFEGKIVERMKVDHPKTAALAPGRKPAKKKPAKKAAKKGAKKASKKPAAKKKSAKKKKAGKKKRL
jgi:hypothetical protein